MRELIERAQRGDHEAFDQLARRIGPELFRLAVVVIGPEAAADVTQDALLRAWRELPTLRDPDAFPAWARRILVNRCRDVVRARRGIQVVSLEADGEAGGLTAHLVAPDPTPGLERSSDLRSAMSALTLDQRSVLALHYGLDLPIREVARSLGVPEGTAKSRMNAALAGLRRKLTDHADA